VVVVVVPSANTVVVVTEPSGFVVVVIVVPSGVVDVDDVPVWVPVEGVVGVVVVVVVVVVVGFDTGGTVVEVVSGTMRSSSRSMAVRSNRLDRESLFVERHRLMTWPPLQLAHRYLESGRAITTMILNEKGTCYKTDRNLPP